VIAVNLDETCDLVKRADLAVIADAETWMQSVIDRMEVSA
jgi:electron transfer flavoprotein alpha subunit